MSHSSRNRFNYGQAQSNTHDFRVIDELVMKPSNERITRQSHKTLVDNANDDDRTVKRLIANQPITPYKVRTPSRSSTPMNDEWNDENRTLRKLIVGQPLNPARSSPRSLSVVSLQSMIIEGKWKYREQEDDQLRLKSIGIENLVTICYEIMTTTLESTKRKSEKQQKYASIKFALPLVKPNQIEQIIRDNRASLKRERILNLMNIVYEATATDQSMSQLVRIWREASHRPKPCQTLPLISYKKVFEHLIRQPGNQLLEIALHASLLSSHSKSDLQRLGKKLGVKVHQFDMVSIQESSENFKNLIKFLREQKLKEKRKQQYINTNLLPFEPKKRQTLYANISDTKFDLIRQAIRMAGFFESSSSDFTCNLLWTDSFISLDIVSALKPYQKINHFPTMNEISRKDLLATNYDKLSNVIPKEYSFAPKTWLLPKEFDLWHSYASNQPKNSSPVYILKPNDAAMGLGIEIYCDYKKIPLVDNYIVQEYIREPYLIEGFKFDLRIYALITSCDPLRVFIYQDGLVRLSPKKYRIPNSKNAFDLSIHLTNYSTDENELYDDFDMDDQKCHKLDFLFEYLRKQNQDDKKLWNHIKDIVLKTAFLVEPHLLATYRSCRPGTLSTSESVCFELLGFDILIDKRLKPWIIEVNRCPSFHIKRQSEFDVNIKLLFDTFNLLRFRVSDRKKSIEIEKLEAQHRLFATIGKDTNNQVHEVNKMKETLYLLRRERQRENFENRHSGGFIRLFPINDQNRMNESMTILTKCFQYLYKDKNDSSWSTKYYNQHNEEELLRKISQLEDVYQTEHHNSSKLSHESCISSELDHLSPAVIFTFEESDEENEFRSQKANDHKIKRSPSSKSDSQMKRVSTQTPFDIIRSSSASSFNIQTKKSNSVTLTGEISRSRTVSDEVPRGVPAHRITEKKDYLTLASSSKDFDEQRSHSAKVTKSNDKSQMVTYSSIIQAMQRQQLDNQPKPYVTIKKLQLEDGDLKRINQLILKYMNQFCIRYPNKTDKETSQIYVKLKENWNEYKAGVGHFWLAESDANKRQSIVDIVWNNVQEIIKKVCIFDELVQELPLNRHLMKLQRRLLANHGQCLWDACQNRHNSWESLFVKSTNHLSNLELDCCYRFVDLCKEALLIVYQYSIDEKFHRQRQIDQGLKVLVTT